MAKATRNSLYLESQLAFQRLREAQILTKVLESEARLTQVKIAEAETQVGMARTHLKTRNVFEESDDELLPALGNNNSPGNSASDSDESGSEYRLKPGMSSPEFTAHRLICEYVSFQQPLPRRSTSMRAAAVFPNLPWAGCMGMQSDVNRRLTNSCNARVNVFKAGL